MRSARARYLGGGQSTGRSSASPGALLAALIAIGGAGAAWAQRAAPVEGFGDIVATIAPAVVNISTRKDVATEAQPDTPPMPQFPPGSPFEEFFKDFFERDRSQQDQQPRRSFSLGSGFVIDATGFVVTNNHVIADADEITVIFNDKSEYPAKLIGTDSKTDLALLKIERPEPFPFVSWADSDEVRVGDWMIAIGNPFGLGSTVTAGIVSARGRDIRAGPYDDFFQIDAPINRGNSGGPSFTLDGNRVRREHRDLLAFRRQRRYRLCHPRQPRQAGDRQPDALGQGGAGLARRAHPERDR